MTEITHRTPHFFHATLFSSSGSMEDINIPMYMRKPMWSTMSDYRHFAQLSET